MSLFSIIIPVCDRPDLLKRAVDSVIHQSFSDWECHIVDDGSATPHPHYHNLQNSLKEGIHYHYYSLNRGVSWARNCGFNLSRGEWISFLDSDDKWLPEKLSAVKSYIETNPDIKIFQTEEIWIRNGRQVNPPEYLRKREGNIFKESLERCLITTSSVVIHRSLLEEERWNERLPTCEDYDLWLRLAARYPIGLLKKPLTIRYQNYGSDQLSKKYPIMDQFRLQALKKFIKTSHDKTKKQLAGGVLIKKAAIILNGASKRKNLWLYLRTLFNYYLWYRFK